MMILYDFVDIEKSSEKECLLAKIGAKTIENGQMLSNVKHLDKT